MPEEELDLIQLAARQVAQTGAGAAIMPGPALPTSCRLPPYAAASGPVTTTWVDLVHAVDLESA